jgi:replicative DNA helicase
MTINTVPPFDLATEKNLLGICLTDPEAIDPILDRVQVGSFYSPDYQKIFKAVEEVCKAGNAVDMLSVSNYLKDHNQLEEVGGASAIANLSADLGLVRDASYMAARIMELYGKRQLLNLANDIQKQIADGEDIDDIITHGNRAISNTLDLFAVGTIHTVSKFLDDAVERYHHNKKLIEQGLPNGITTPLIKLTRMTGGFQKSDLVLLGARPSMGKTAFALSMLKEASLSGHKPILFSLEMSGVRLADRLLIGLCDLDPYKFNRGKLTTQEEQLLEDTIGKMERYCGYIDDSPNLTINRIAAKARALHKKGECDMILIDYVGLITPESKKNSNREQEVALISRQAKLLAKELNVPVVLLSQLNRSCELRMDKKPLLADLRESGALEQDADIVLFLYRPAYYDISEVETSDGAISSEGVGICSIAKHRNGPLGDILFRHNESMTVIEDYDNSQKR